MNRKQARSSRKRMVNRKPRWKPQYSYDLPGSGIHIGARSRAAGHDVTGGLGLMATVAALVGSSFMRKPAGRGA